MNAEGYKKLADQAWEATTQAQTWISRVMRYVLVPMLIHLWEWTTEPQKWEYSSDTSEDEPYTDEMLDKMGAEGWELVSMAVAPYMKVLEGKAEEHGIKYHYVFKQRVRK